MPVTKFIGGTLYPYLVSSVILCLRSKYHLVRRATKQASRSGTNMMGLMWLCCSACYHVLRGRLSGQLGIQDSRYSYNDIRSTCNLKLHAALTLLVFILFMLGLVSNTIMFVFVIA